MKKLILFGGIGLVITAILAVWALIAGIGLVSENFPQLIAGIERITGITFEQAKKALQGITERAKEVSPEITKRVEDIIPGKEIPEKDVGGEDIAGIPRYPNMVRFSFEIKDGKKTIGYTGGVEFSSVIDFYNKEMSALKFKKKILSASPVEETHEYRKGKIVLEINFKKFDRLGTSMTEMVIKEI